MSQKMLLKSLQLFQIMITPTAPLPCSAAMNPARLPRLRSRLRTPAMTAQLYEPGTPAQCRTALAETHSNTSIAVGGGDPSENSSAVDREVSMKQLLAIVLEKLKEDLHSWLTDWEMKPPVIEVSTYILKMQLGWWRGKISDEQVESICKFYDMTF